MTTQLETLFLKEKAYNNLMESLQLANTKLIASQLREKALRDALSRTKHGNRCFAGNINGGVNGCLCGLDKALSLPTDTDTAEADALLARVKELEEQVIHFRFQADEAGFCRVRYGQQLTTARAVIEEAEKALKHLLNGLTPDSNDDAFAAISRIREWKEGGK